MASQNRFEDFVSTIRALDLTKVDSAASIPSTFRIGQEGEITSHYIPFEHVNSEARVVLVGITPGFTQWKNAMREAQVQLSLGAPLQDLLNATKQIGAFSGAMRPNLIALLDRIGIQTWLGLETCETLFSTSAHLVQSTSILCHPIHVDGKNYSGNPSMIKNRFLQEQMCSHFANEARQLKNAVFVPLGPKVSEGLDWLAGRGAIDRDRVLHGLPHPSGANAERIAYFLGRKDGGLLSVKTNAAKLDALRADLTSRVLSL